MNMDMGMENDPEATIIERLAERTEQLEETVQTILARVEALENSLPKDTR